MAKGTRDILIGLAMLAALAVLMAYLYAGRQVASEAGRMHLTAVFNRVDGLYQGDPVHLAGIPVGRVESMHLNDDYRPVVRFSLRDDIKLPKDSSASIQTDGLFGSKFVVVEPGGELDNLQDGDRISYTQDAVVVGDLLDLIISEGEAAQAGKGGGADDQGANGTVGSDFVPSLGGGR